MDNKQKNTIKQIVAQHIDLIRFAVKMDKVSVKSAVEAFADKFVSEQFERYTKEEILNAVRNGWVFNFKSMLVAEIMADEEIKSLDQMELKLV